MSDYKHMRASIRAGAQKGSVPKSEYVNLFQHTLDEQFYNASNWYQILEETEIGSKEYKPVDVRISHVINAETGLKLGDDWKTLYFKSTEEPPMLGRIYTFDDNIWLTTNIEAEKNLTNTCTIRRCNNTLRWLDEGTGVYYEEPCAIEYLVKEPRDYATQGSPFKTPGGFLHIEAQFNSRTNLINENQRFLFGNPGHWTGYRVLGTGLNDFRNTKTYDWRSTKLLTIDMIADFVNNELDDIVNGIANAGINLYTLNIVKNNILGNPNNVVQMDAIVTYNGHTTTRNIIWQSSDTNVATVDSNGIVLFKAIGECTLIAHIEGNPTFDTCAVTCIEGNDAIVLEVKANPSTNYILEGETKTFNVYLYANNIQQDAKFEFTCITNGVPLDNFTFTSGSVPGNQFTIENKEKYIEAPLTIRALTDAMVKHIDIYLRGAWISGDVP